MTTPQTWRSRHAQIQRLATAKGRANEGRFSIEGTRLHERALRAGWPIEAVLVTEEYCMDESARVQSLLKSLREADCEIHTAPSRSLREITKGRDYGAIVGVVPLPPPPKLATLVSPSAVFLTLVNVFDPGNVGAMVRSAHASGATAVIAIGHSDPFHPKAVRTSMGSAFKIPLLYRPHTAETLAELTQHGVLRVGTVAHGGVPLPSVQWGASAVALLMGSEAHGLPNQIADQIDLPVTIPMGSGVDSFSVNAAAAIVLYEVMKR